MNYWAFFDKERLHGQSGSQNLRTNQGNVKQGLHHSFLVISKKVNSPFEKD